MTELPRKRLAQTPLLFLGISITVGILIGRYVAQSRWLWIVANLSAGSAAAVSIYFVHRKHLVVAGSFLIAAFAVTGLVLSLIANGPIASSRIKRMFDEGALLPNEPVELTALIQGQPESAPDGFYLTLRAESIRTSGLDRAASGNVVLFASERETAARSNYESLDLRHSARIRVMTLLNRDEDYRNPGVMPITEYLDRKDFDATGVIKSPLLIERFDDAKVFLPLAWLYDWRERLEKQFDRRFSSETAGVLDAVLLGNRYKVSRDVADRFRAGGTFHVLVIAGLHISFIAGLVFFVMRRLTRNRILQFVCATSFLLAYSVAVGAQPPVMRAALVFTLGIFAPLVWRRANSLNVIAGAAVALLVWRPNDLFDPSFQLTFLSVISIVTFTVPIMTRMQAVGSWRPTHETPYPPVCASWFRKISEALFWSEHKWKAEMAASNIRYRLFKTRAAGILERWHLQRLLRFATAAIVVSASVQIGMLPVLIIYFHRVSFASLLLNIFVGVLMAAIGLIALVAVVIAQISTTISLPLVWIVEKLEWLMVHAVDPFTRLSIASLRLPHYHGWAAAIYALYFATLVCLIVALTRWNPLRPQWIVGGQPFRPTQAKLAALVFTILLSLIFFHPFSATRADGKLHIDFLDVGQGDCALVTMPDGATLLIDGGGRPNIDWNKNDDLDAEPTFERDTGSIGERVVSEFLWARGLDSVDYILPTHADADHIDGLNDVARNFKVRGAIVARTPTADADYAQFAVTMQQAGIPIQKVGVGDVLEFGDVRADVIWPPASTDGNASYQNNDGLVLRIRYADKTFLFMADVEKETEAALLRSGIDLHAEVIKVAHHGSRTSSTQSFVNAAHASLAIISVGRTSIFGHPHKEVTERWRASGTQVMTTGEQGTISLVTDGRDLNVSTYVRH